MEEKTAVNIENSMMAATVRGGGYFTVHGGLGLPGVQHQATFGAAV